MSEHSHSYSVAQVLACADDWLFFSLSLCPPPTSSCAHIFFLNSHPTFGSSFCLFLSFFCFTLLNLIYWTLPLLLSSSIGLSLVLLYNFFVCRVWFVSVHLCKRKLFLWRPLTWSCVLFNELGKFLFFLRNLENRGSKFVLTWFIFGRCVQPSARSQWSSGKQLWRAGLRFTFLSAGTGISISRETCQRTLP